MTPTSLRAETATATRDEATMSATAAPPAEAARPAFARPPAPRGAPARRPGRTPATRLAALVDAIGRAVRDTPEDRRAGAVAAAIGAHVADPALLDGIATPCCAERYLRHLLHEDAEAGWAVAALVWRPGQMSPVHAHRAWCAVGVHRGVLVESYHAPGEGLAPSSVQLRRPGDTSGGPADPALIHRLANLGGETAISIHAYGLPFARFCTSLNTIHAP